MSAGVTTSVPPRLPASARTSTTMTSSSAPWSRDTSTVAPATKHARLLMGTSVLPDVAPVVDVTTSDACSRQLLLGAPTSAAAMQTTVGVAVSLWPPTTPPKGEPWPSVAVVAVLLGEGAKVNACGALAFSASSSASSS